jgi:hypothetical protein
LLFAFHIEDNSLLGTSCLSTDEISPEYIELNVDKKGFPIKKRAVTPSDYYPFYKFQT